MLAFLHVEHWCFKRQRDSVLILFNFDGVGAIHRLWRYERSGTVLAHVESVWTLTDVDPLRAFRFLLAASFRSRWASLSARSFSIPCSSYHWAYSWRLLEAASSLKALILSSWWACRWPLELMWVKRWDMSENRCFFGQAVQTSGMEPSGVRAPVAAAELTRAMLRVCTEKVY